MPRSRTAVAAFLLLAVVFVIVGILYQTGNLQVATSAEEAKALGFFRKTDGVSFDRARQLTEAKARCIGLAASGYHPPTPHAHVLPGESGIATLYMMVDTLVAGGFVLRKVLPVDQFLWSPHVELVGVFSR